MGIHPDVAVLLDLVPADFAGGEQFDWAAVEAALGADAVLPWGSGMNANEPVRGLPTRRCVALETDGHFRQPARATSTAQGRTGSRKAGSLRPHVPHDRGLALIMTGAGW
ncbi:hypothetical protein GCM10010510_18430 [Streptomyces anandii JCM 4720]|nr:hypothetical protein GCM10010510_18430 [Streptomyces anandii JCM 4720]